MATNPFITSTAVRTQNLFFGRLDEIKQLYAAISAAAPQHCAVIGLPKSGKSSLLTALANAELQKQFLADPTAFLFVPVDCSLAHLDTPSDLYVRLIEYIAKACGREISGGDILDGAAFMAMVNELRGQRRMVLLLDEFDTLLAAEGCNDAMLANMRGFAGPDVALVVAANDTVERICRRAQKTQAELWTLFDMVIYPRLLNPNEAHQAIKQPITDAGLTLDDAVIDFVIDLVGPHPFFLQIGGKELFDALSAGTSLDDGGRARLRDRLAEVCRSYFSGFWREITPDDQAVLAAIIAGAGLPPKGLAVAQRLRNWNLLVVDQDDYVPFSKLFGEFAKATLVGEQPQPAAPQPAQPRCVLSIFCDSYAKNVAVRLQGAASLVVECDEPLDRNIRSFAIRGREDARSDSWRELIKISGRELYQKLFDSHLRMAEAYQCGRAATSDGRLTLHFMGPRDFIGLPFELLHDEDGRALALDHPISRMVTGQVSTRPPLNAAFFDRPPTPDAPRLALVMSANVSGEIVLKGRHFALPPVPGVEEEGLKVKAALEQHGWQVTLLSGAALTLESASAALDGCKHDLIHFSGHGFYAQLDPDSSGLVLRDAAGDVAILEALRLRQLLKESRVRLVFLSCCEGAASGDAAHLLDSDYLGVIDALVAAGVPAALGYRWPVDAAGATLLAQTFYDKLHQSTSIEAALLLARQEVRSQLDDQTWISPILVVQE
jgi:CHAT domain-containing protein